MQTIALSLLIAVQTLLLQAQKTPDLKPEIRAQIDQVAQVALTVATQALNAPVLEQAKPQRVIPPEEQEQLDNRKYVEGSNKFCYYVPDYSGRDVVVCGG